MGVRLTQMTGWRTVCIVADINSANTGSNVASSAQLCALGGTPRVVAENKEALRSLMQLHPLNLAKLASGTAAHEPPSPNPLLDKNPFGGVPLSALRESPRSVTSKGPTTRGSDNGHFGAALTESAALLQDEQHQAGADGSSRNATLFNRPDPVGAASYLALVKDQVSIELLLTCCIGMCHAAYTDAATRDDLCAKLHAKSKVHAFACPPFWQYWVVAA